MEAMAAVATAVGRVEFLRVAVPDPGPQDVVVRVSHSWISSGTEGSFVRGERIGGDTPRTEHDPLPFPHVPGYQKVGIIEWAGADAGGLKPGDRVFATISRVEGMFFDTGGHVSPAVTHRSQVWKLPDLLEPWTASGLVLTQVGFNCGSCSALAAGDSAVVIGDGMVGHWSAQTLQRRGARVMMLGRHDERLRLLRSGGQDCTFNVESGDPAAAVLAWAPDGVQVTVDTVGSIPAMLALFPAMKRFSQLVSAGFYGCRGQIDIQRMRDREMTLHAPSGWTTGRMNETLALLAGGAIETAHLVTHRFPAARAGAAFDLILSRREPVLGVVLDWE